MHQNEKSSHDLSSAPAEMPNEIEDFIASMTPHAKESLPPSAREHLSAKAITEEIRSLTPPLQAATEQAAMAQRRVTPRVKEPFVPDYSISLSDLPQQPVEVARHAMEALSAEMAEASPTDTDAAQDTIDGDTEESVPASTAEAEMPAEDALPSFLENEACAEEEERPAEEDALFDRASDPAAEIETSFAEESDFSEESNSLTEENMIFDGEAANFSPIITDRYLPFAPHIHTAVTTRSLMTDAMIALLPALCWSVFAFGWRALTVTLLSVLCCVIFELWFELIAGRVITVGDGSAVVSGMLLAFLLPAGVPFWIVPIGAALSMIVLKGLFGGIGRNLFNPALTAALILRLVFGSMMTASPSFGANLGAFEVTPQFASAPTVLTGTQLFFGTGSGTIGTVSALMLLLGGVYLLCRRVVDWRIPAAFLAAMCLLSYLMPTGSDALFCMLEPLYSGAILLPVLFMATDPTTSPVTSLGKVIYAAVGGALAWALGYYLYPYVKDMNVMIAVIAIGLLARPLDRLTRPAPFGAYSKLVKHEKKRIKRSSVFREDEN